METITISPGVRLTVINELKFKTACLSMNVLSPLKKETAALNAVLPYVLRRGTASKPDMQTIEAFLDDNYGARLEAFVRKRGEIQICGFYSDFADEAFLGGETGLLERMTDLMGEMLLSPATFGGRLRKEYVDTERENLIADIRASLNDKRGYANLSLIQNMFKKEAYGVPKLGRELEARKISVATLTRHYKSLIASSPVEVIYVGAENPRRVAAAVKSALSARAPVFGAEIPQTSVFGVSSAKPKFIREEMPLKQAKLSLGYRIEKDAVENDQPALTVMNAIFGGAVTSKLFREVREKRGLCYYASSTVDRMKRAMFVSCGIDTGKYDEAMEAIEAELRAMQNGEITDEELESAKSFIVGAMYSVEDSLPARESVTLNFLLQGLDIKPSEFGGLCDLVTKEEVVACARRVQLDTVFFLAGKGEGK
ncbi:MAG: insulinase family protein [Oscillospiraceae bacterium]|nr:insulinase family protein [Oscillospiraceae bacterium]